ncbi:MULTISPECIES: cysteine desulfurase [unclassified Imperialibacter]|uniref:cysteine desulfurase n=1 Tax=unclassified Imperialibacter TaxID=2629706 RepID=UPI0012521CCE|nr:MULTISPECIES: cysteine desulfurase [unclassified Imperialibacter]CAD5257833.1 selenocysteine lyase, PLP-dependent [Imperialibacter sp. 89]CAD5272844.1 selenocysteine lyase, PLP-dependent [Imperialibacter sp. 75]VVT32438.1 selenocysteine lyase, PLP-dependent [Imperialibacter sp. EC-SDR9]
MGSPASTIDWSLDIQSIRKQFPVLHQEVNGKPLIYFDNAATNQKPVSVIKALDHYYETDNANIHRGVHTLAERATADFEGTRKKAAAFLNSNEVEEIIFTKGTTESINLVASTWGRKFVNPGDEIIISTLEHHSNIVPWQMLCEEKGAVLKVIPINSKGEIIVEEFKKLLSTKTKLVSVVFASNALGTVNPVAEIIALAHQTGAIVMLDGAQASAHLEVDVQKLDIDFFALSAHKMYGPTGVGVLYGKRSLLEAMPPYQGGGEMISEVTFEKTTYNAIPYKFEAGTPNIADVIAFGAAIDFVNEHGKERIAAHEEELLHYATAKLENIPGVTIVGQAADKVSVVSFLVNGYHPLDVGMYLDARGIAVRTGHHCTQPLMKHLGIEGTVRASFSVYNTKEEIDRLAEAVTLLAGRKN